MKRRTFISQTMMAAAIAALAPSCMGDKKKPLSLHHLQVDDAQLELLSNIVDTIIPETDVPGAKALNVHRFVLTMVDDCYEPEDQQEFIKALTQLNELSTKENHAQFSALENPQREDLLELIESKSDSVPSELASSYPIIKDLTIQGFMTSQYVMEKIMGFQLIPGHFNGCVSVEKDKQPA